MALMNCPSCSKKVSDKAEACQHCGFAIGSATSDDLHRKASLRRYKQQQSIQTQSMLAMLLFIGGFGFMYWGGATPEDMQYKASVGALVIGFIWYIVNRIRLIFVKKADD
ncbi:hypothetical protein HMF8227_01678 [Saliniradius amylolyticus]|uniref:Zinc ribbon domain-containing protein n=1 Tax=Saliniradius amylolyticus TaxID=2183582 RepID=A0A2S2E3D2_9ALTE|nr:zinc ribbon domain-containing protein [Saliniradius amylolyticus]AWL12151.1 hypothetical protein HMF8227_01678 [Saliniradius amylolyticus]